MAMARINDGNPSTTSMIRIMTLSSHPPQIPGDGTDHRSDHHRDEHRGEPEGQAHSGPIDDPAEEVPDVAVQAHDVLGDLAAEDVEHRRQPSLRAWLADEILVRVVRGDQGGEYRHQDHEADQDQAGYADFALEEATDGDPPHRAGLLEQ